MPISATCPECGKCHLLADALGGKRIRCPVCREIVDVPAATPQSRVAIAPATVAANGERVAAKCLTCQCTMMVAKVYAGKTIRCVRCSNAVLVAVQTRQQAATDGSVTPDPVINLRPTPVSSSQNSGSVRPRIVGQIDERRKQGRRRRKEAVEELHQTYDEFNDALESEIDDYDTLMHLSEEERIAYGLSKPKPKKEKAEAMTDRRDTVMAFGYRDEMGMHQSTSGNWNVMLFVILAAVLCLGVGAVVHNHTSEPQSGSATLMLDLAIVVGLSPLIAAGLTFQMIVYSEDLITGYLLSRIPFLGLICLFDNRYNHPMVWRMFVLGLVTTAITFPMLLIFGTG